MKIVKAWRLYFDKQPKCFLSQEDADDAYLYSDGHCNPEVVEVLVTDDGRYFLLERRTVVYTKIDDFERERALAKLSPKERELLGISL